MLSLLLLVLLLVLELGMVSCMAVFGMNRDSHHRLSCGPANRINFIRQG